MKKFYVLWPTISAYLISTFSAIVLPASRTHIGEYSGQYSYGYPFPFLHVDKEITLSLNTSLIDDCMGINLASLLINIVFLVLIINFSYLYLKLFF